MRFIFKTSATMKDYNRGKWWIDEGIIREKIITADSTAEALDKYVKSVGSDDYITITKNAIKNKGEMYIEEEDDSPFNLKQLCKKLEKAFDDKGIWDMAIKDWVL